MSVYIYNNDYNKLNKQLIGLLGDFLFIWYHPPKIELK